MKAKLLIFVLFIIVTTTMLKNLKNAPQGLKLKNHFGLPSVENKYGPKTDNIAQYVEANPETFVPMMYSGNAAIKKSLEFKPYPGYETKLSPHQIKSGDMTNLAPSASRIISPKIAPPILEIKSQLHYPAAVAYPTFTGMKKEWHPVTAFNKETGEIVHDKVLVSYPNIQKETHVSNIVRDHTLLVNLNRGSTKSKFENVEGKQYFGSERN